MLQLSLVLPFLTIKLVYRVKFPFQPTLRIRSAGLFHSISVFTQNRAALPSLTTSKGRHLHMAEPTDEHPSQLRRNAISGPSGLAALNSSLEEHRRQLDGCSHEVNWGSADEFRPASRQASITPDPKRETENFARPASYSPRPYQWSTRETIIGESPVIADIRTNIIVSVPS